MTDKKRLVIGLTGPMVTGKGTIADYIKEHYGATCYGFSGPLRDVLKRLYIPMVRENLANLSHCLRDCFGQDLISKTIVSDINADQSEIIIMDGIRRPSDLEQAKKIEGFVLVQVFAEQQTRYERLLKRRQNADDQTKTLEQFQADENAEADRQIPLVMAEANYSIDNNGDFATLYEQVDDLMAKLLDR